MTVAPSHEIIEKSFRVCRSLAEHGKNPDLTLEAFTDEIGWAKDVEQELLRLGSAALSGEKLAPTSNRQALQLLSQARSILKQLINQDGDGRSLLADADLLVDEVDDLFEELVLG